MSHPIGPREAFWASRSGPLLSGAPSGRMGPRGIGGMERWKKRGQGGGTLQEWRIRRNASSISPAHSDPGNLLRSWTRSSSFQGQRHSRARPAALSLSSPSHPARAFSGPLGPKHRPCPLLKPRLCLSPVPHSQGIFWLFLFPFFSSFFLL